MNTLYFPSIEPILSEISDPFWWHHVLKSQSLLDACNLTRISSCGPAVDRNLKNFECWTQHWLRISTVDAISFSKHAPSLYEHFTINRRQNIDVSSTELEFDGNCRQRAYFWRDPSDSQDIWKVSAAVLSVKTDPLPDNENSLSDKVGKKRQILFFWCSEGAKMVRMNSKEIKEHENLLWI